MACLPDVRQKNYASQKTDLQTTRIPIGPYDPPPAGPAGRVLRRGRSAGRHRHRRCYRTRRRHQLYGTSVCHEPRAARYPSSGGEGCGHGNREAIFSQGIAGCPVTRAALCGSRLRAACTPHTAFLYLNGSLPACQSYWPFAPPSPSGSYRALPAQYLFRTHSSPPTPTSRATPR